jgi:hypothetical protein
VYTGEIEGIAVRFFNDGNELAFLGYKGVEFWRPGVVSGAHKTITNPKESDWTIRGFDIKDNMMVLVGGYSSSRADIQLWNLNTATQVNTIHRANDAYFMTAAFLAEKNQIWTTDYNFKGQVIDIEEGFSTRKINLKCYCGFSQVDPINSNIVIVGDANGQLRLFDLRSPGEDAALCIAPSLGSFESGSIKRKESTPNHIFVGTTSGVKQFDIRTGLPVASSTLRATSIAVHHNTLVVGNGTGLQFFDTTKGIDTNVHDLNYTNFFPKYMDMNSKVLFINHYGSQNYAVTWDPVRK